MTDHRDKRHSPLELEARSRTEIADPVSGADIAINEIQDVVIDTGYSADQRKGWVKKVLTELARRQLTYPSADRARLIDVLKNIVNENQRRSPIVDDVM